MIIALVTLVHLFVCFILIISVLLQSGKGADLAGAFGGGGSQTAFGSRGPATFLTRLTTVAAITFMATSLALSLFYSQGAASAVSSVPLEDPSSAKPAASRQVTPSPLKTEPEKGTAPTENPPKP